MLTSLALFGFGQAYGGSRYFLAGAAGMVVGGAVAWWGASARQPLIVVTAATVVAFFLFGGAAAVPDVALAGILPGPAAAGALIDGAIQGWARLLTTYPPVGTAANLLVIPYLCGVVSGVLALSIAARTRRPTVAVLVPFAVLVLSILFGTKQPASLLLQGALFGVVAIWWISHVQRRRRRVDVGRRASRRWLSIAAVLLAAGTVSYVGADLVPGYGTRPRVILRDYTEPPFDPQDYPSPLSSYRRFTNGAPQQADGAEPEASRASGATNDGPPGWGDEELFEVRGLAPDQRLRLATMDTYTDGVVYEVGTGSESSGFFQRVGEVLPEAPEGDETVQVEVEVLGDGDTAEYDEVWLPVADGVRSLRFDPSDAERATELAAEVRYNSATSTVAMPVPLVAGDRYSMEAVVVPQPDPAELVDVGGDDDVSQADPVQLQALTSLAQRVADGEECDRSEVDDEESGDGERGDEGDPDAPAPEDEAPSSTPAESAFGSVERFADYLVSCGALSDVHPSDPGHHGARLDGMASGDGSGMLGNGEQYAPLAALAARTFGLPSRVVMGFRSQEESDDRLAEIDADAHGDVYTVRGADVTAWIEVALEDHGWVPIRDVVGQQDQPLERPPPTPTSPESDPPPPPPSLPPSDEDLAETERVVDRDDEQEDEGFVLPAWLVKTLIGVSLPLLVLALITGSIAGIKARRRTRRRTRGSPDERIKGGWQEVCDLAHDRGAPVPPRVTRREAATLIGGDEPSALARHADAVVFGPGEPTEDQVEKYWHQVDATRQAMVADLSRFGRWKVLVSLASLRPTGRRGRAVTARAISYGSAPAPGAPT